MKSIHFYYEKITVYLPSSSLNTKQATSKSSHLFIDKPHDFSFLKRIAMPVQLLQGHLAYSAYRRDICQGEGRWTLGNTWQNACGTDKASEGTCTPAAPSSCRICFFAATWEVPQSKGISAPFAEPKPTKKLGKEGGRGRREKRSATAICCAGVVLLHCRLTSMREDLKHSSLLSNTRQGRD